MTDTLQLFFAEDMPPAAVEVVTPEFRTIAQLWLGPGERAAVDVPSADALVQIHMPMGDTVTLRDFGASERVIHRALLFQHSGAPDGRSGSVLQSFEEISARRGETSGLTSPRGRPPGPTWLNQDTSIRLTTEDGNTIQASESEDGGALFEPQAATTAYDLRVSHRGESYLDIRCPGSLLALTVRLEQRHREPTVRIRATTSDRVADSLGAYLGRGNLRAAMGMRSLDEEAQARLYREEPDPSAASIFGYLLLQLCRFELMREWPRDLADRWPSLADGSIIQAWQLMQQGNADDEIEAYLSRAATARHLPVFTQGLQLLTDGLRLLGAPATPLLESLDERAGFVLWESPFSAYLSFSSPSSRPTLRADVGYAIERVPVESSALDTIGYDSASRILQVRFKDGPVYEYYGVPERHFRELQQAESVGLYFNSRIRPAGYEFQRIK